MRDLVVFAGLVAALVWALRGDPSPARERVAPGFLPPSAPLRAPPAPAPAAGAVTVPYDQLSYFDYDPEADVIPEDVLALDGRRIELIGVMYYGVEDPDRVTEFYLMPNHMVCCYGTFRINEAVEVTLRPGLRTQYVLNYYLVRGTLHVGAVRDDRGRVLHLYRVDGAEAEILQ